MLDKIGDFLSKLMGFLPTSPFQSLLAHFDDAGLLNALNYFIPFDLMTGLTETWLVCVVAWYIWGRIFAKIDSLI